MISLREVFYSSKGDKEGLEKTPFTDTIWVWLNSSVFHPGHFKLCEKRESENSSLMATRKNYSKSDIV